MQPLKAALLAGTISGNPRMAVGEDEQPANGGWMTSTSEIATSPLPIIWSRYGSALSTFSLESTATTVIGSSAERHAARRWMRPDAP